MVYWKWKGLLHTFQLYHHHLGGSSCKVFKLCLLVVRGQALEVEAGEDGDDVLVHGELVVSLEVLESRVLPVDLYRGLRGHGSVSHHPGLTQVLHTDQGNSKSKIRLDETCSRCSSGPGKWRLGRRCRRLGQKGRGNHDPSTQSDRPRRRDACSFGEFHFPHPLRASLG